ncbi:uncharacterized protein G2W53_026043 [Senna tora]|uniref:Uncharacterized protein n=1 Tax=Senna tora TaxID=362788 RepID=A0A834TED8_9FABA|nr:uncharacterized protein G2W53_026043 [Senna tora]
MASTRFVLLFPEEGVVGVSTRSRKDEIYGP